MREFGRSNLSEFLSRLSFARRPLINLQVAMTAFVEDNALGFQQQPLKLGFVKQQPSGRNAAARVDDSMPGYAPAVVRRSMHCPADQPRAVAVFKKPRDLSVGHHTTARDAEYHSVDLLKDALELRMSRLRGIDRFDGGLSVRQVFPSIPGFIGQRIIIRSTGKGGNREARLAGRRRAPLAGDLCHRPVANCVEFSVTDLSAHFDLFTRRRLAASLGHQGWRQSHNDWHNLSVGRDAIC